MFVLVYYFILSFVIIYIIHNFILYLKTTFTLPKVLDISSDFTMNINHINKQINKQSIYNTSMIEEDETLTQSNQINSNSVSLKKDIDELTTYLQNITTPTN